LRSVASWRRSSCTVNAGDEAYLSDACSTIGGVVGSKLDKPRALYG
jgi:hypothetical protein